jgi:hypothetical protein
MRKDLFKRGVMLLLGLSMIHSACKKERDESSKDETKTLSKKEVLDYFNEEKNFSKPRNYDPDYVVPDLSQISNEKILNSSQLLTVIPATTIYPEHYSRILLLKINGEIKAVVFSMYGSKNTTSDKFTGEILITDLHGSFINGFRVSEGLIKTQFKKVKTSNVLKTSMSITGIDLRKKPELMVGGVVCDEHGECIGGSTCVQCTQNLDEFIVTFAPVKNYVPFFYIFYLSFDYNYSSILAWNYANVGGGSETTLPCGSNFIINKITNKCIPKPCLGDPVSNPEIAPQKNSKIPGGLHNTCARRDQNRTCYGKIGYRLHDGVDIKNEFGDPIYAMHDGNAIIKYEKNGAGHYVAVTSIINGEKVILTYFHLQETGLKSGTVNAGDIIGYQGDSGNLEIAIKKGYAMSHVHVKAKKNGVMANPLNYFQTKIDPKTGKGLNPCY